MKNKNYIVQTQTCLLDSMLVTPDCCRFIIILDPGIYNQDPEGVYPTFDRGMAGDVWVKDIDNVTNYPGEVWPGNWDSFDWWV